MPPLLLITGSRDATPAMLAYADRAVARCRELEWVVIVGDAEGVDAQVIGKCHHIGVPFACYGITASPRNFCCQGHLGNYLQAKGDYLARDRQMVEAADRVLAIWNGQSRGTKYTYDYAVKLGKRADIRTFKGEMTHATLV